MQVDTTTIAVVGTVSHMTSGEGVPGNDWALIRIDPAVAAKWGVTPAIPVAGGPNGVYSRCDVGTPVLHYGHGYGVAVAQGKLEGGVAPTGTTTASAGPASARRATPAPR